MFDKIRILLKLKDLEDRIKFLESENKSCLNVVNTILERQAIQGEQIHRIITLIGNTQHKTAELAAIAESIVSNHN